jgi:hypothetical protein
MRPRTDSDTLSPAIDALAELCEAAPESYSGLAERPSHSASAQLITSSAARSPPR